MFHKCKVHMNMKQRRWGVEHGRHAVGAKAAQLCTGLQTNRFRIAPYSVINANFTKFASIFRDGADVALKQGTHEHEAKRMGS